MEPSPDTYRSLWEDDLTATFAQLDSVLLLFEAVQTSTHADDEYAKFLKRAVTNLRPGLQKLDGKAASVKGQRADRDRLNFKKLIQACKTFLELLQSRIAPRGQQTQSDVGGDPNLKWQLSYDDVSKLVSDADGLLSNIRFLSEEFWLIETNRDRSSAAPPLLLLDKLRDLKNTLFPPPVLGPWIRIQGLRQWLDSCDTRHSSHCQISAQTEQIYKHYPQWLIDVKRYCLVSPGNRPRYVALSYVWGTVMPLRTLKQNLDILQQEGSLLADRSEEDEMARRVEETSLEMNDKPQQILAIPKTVRNVIEVTRLLGEKFLWVDALCIVQDDEENKHQQLQNMGSIYANAYVTIVAASGNALSGLRGIENGSLPMDRRNVAPYYLFRDYYHFQVHSEIKKHHEALQASSWSSRAWTFQEQIFSRRLLIFENTRVAWECHCAVWLEGMTGEEGLCRKKGKDIAQGLSFKDPADFSDYALHVQQYNQRSLTYPEDALDAFAGILGTLNSAFVGGFLCGLPVMFFDLALLWYNTVPLKRRFPRPLNDSANRLPTWTWAAWDGPVLFTPGQASQDRSLRPLVKWKYGPDSEGKLREISIPNLQDPAALARQVETDEARDPNVQTPGHANNEGSQDLPEPTAYLLSSRTERTHFRGLEVFEGVQILLADQSGDCVGTMSICEGPREGSKPSDMVFEVVAISEQEVHGDVTVNVLWIEWENGITLRKGVGRVLKSAWDAQDREYIDLVLG